MKNRRGQRHLSREGRAAAGPINATKKARWLEFEQILGQFFWLVVNAAPHTHMPDHLFQLDLPTSALEEKDFIPVYDLLAELKRRDGIAKALFTWLNAFTVFKNLEKRLGLPRTPSDKVVYLAIVTELRSAGYLVLQFVESHGAPGWLESEGISLEAFQACIEELRLDDHTQHLEENPDIVAKLKAALV